MGIYHYFKRMHKSKAKIITYEALAEVSNVHPPQPLPSREWLIYQPSPLVGEQSLISSTNSGKELKPNRKKRTSKIDIAWHVLKNAGRPLHVSEIIQLAKRDFQVQLDRDSIVSGIIKKANAWKMFIRTALNTFASKEQH